MHLMWFYILILFSFSIQFAQQDEWTLLCDTLGSRLFAAGETLPATLCFICAGNVDKTIEIWSRTLSDIHDGISYFDLLQVLCCLVMFWETCAQVQLSSFYVCSLSIGFNGKDHSVCTCN